jgi:hypothetical protein
MLKSIVSVLLVCTLLMVGCTPPNTSQLVTALNAVADASSVAVVVTESLVALGKVSPQVAAQVSTYATGVNGAVTTSIAELNSTDPNPVKITKITAAFAAVATPAFGTQAPAITAAINAVATAVEIFLGQLNSSTTVKLAKVAPKVAPTSLMVKGDKDLLKKIQAKVAETNAKAAKLVVKK